MGRSTRPSGERLWRGRVTAKGSSYKPGAFSPPARKLRALKGEHEGLTGYTHTANNSAVWMKRRLTPEQRARGCSWRAVQSQPTQHRATLLGQGRVHGSKRRCGAYQKLNYGLIWGEMQNNSLADRPLCYSGLWNISITLLSFPAVTIAEVPAVMWDPIFRHKRSCSN